MPQWNFCYSKYAIYLMILFWQRHSLLPFTSLYFPLCPYTLAITDVPFFQSWYSISLRREGGWLVANSFDFYFSKASDYYWTVGMGWDMDPRVYVYH